MSHVLILEVWSAHGAIQPGMLDFSPRTVRTTTIVKLCTVLGWSQCFAILEWGLVNPEKIVGFLDRRKVDMYFQSYYLSLYDSLRSTREFSTVPQK